MDWQTYLEQQEQDQITGELSHREKEWNIRRNKAFVVGFALQLPFSVFGLYKAVVMIVEWMS